VRQCIFILTSSLWISNIEVPLSPYVALTAQCSRSRARSRAERRLRSCTVIVARR